MKEDDDDIVYVSDPEAKNLSFHLLKADNDLFDEEKYKRPEPVISIKRIKMPKKKEDWAVLENGKIVFRMKDYRFTQAEKDFLRTPEGMQLLIREYKAGARSVAAVKKAIKKYT